jgi:site-specific recombinase XerC
VRFKELPVHHKLEELLDQYLKATGLEKEPQSPLFPASIGKTGKLSRRPLVRTDAADMLKRRLKQAGLPAHYSPHSFRATGITNFLENDGTLEAAQRIAGHADSRTTKLYDRREINSAASYLRRADALLSYYSKRSQKPPLADSISWSKSNQLSYSRCALAGGQVHKTPPVTAFVDS